MEEGCRNPSERGLCKNDIMESLEPSWCVCMDFIENILVLVVVYEQTNFSHLQFISNKPKKCSAIFVIKCYWW